ncbi:unnamed protein product, partial [marine sediment metagenome]
RAAIKLPFLRFTLRYDELYDLTYCCLRAWMTLTQAYPKSPTPRNRTRKTPNKY